MQTINLIGIALLGLLLGACGGDNNKASALDGVSDVSSQGGNSVSLVVQHLQL